MNVTIQGADYPQSNSYKDAAMKPLKSDTTTKGDRAAAARSLWRATGGLSIGHVSPEAAAGGLIALVEEGDSIEINSPERRIDLKVDQATIDARRAALEASEHGYRPPAPRRRRVSTALRAYAGFASSADTGGVRDLSKVEGA